MSHVAATESCSSADTLMDTQNESVDHNSVNGQLTVPIAITVKTIVVPQVLPLGRKWINSPERACTEVYDRGSGEKDVIRCLLS